MADYEVLDLSDKVKWDEYLQRIPGQQQDIYFTPEYYSLYEDLGDGKAKCFVFKKDNNIALYPFLLNSVNGLGYNLSKSYYDIQGAYGYNGVVSNDCSVEFISDFYKALEKYILKENIIAEFTRFHPLLKNHSFSQKHLQIIYDRKVIWLELNKSFDEIFSKFQTTTRKQIKRATRRYHLEVKIFENDTSILNDIYHIYYESMLRVQSIPYLFFNKSYFKSLIESTKSTSFVAFDNKKPVAWILAFHNKYYINGHIGGTLTDYLNISPFSLLYAEMIKFGQKKGCRYLNVGGGATGNPSDSLLAYKMNFSKTTSDFYIGKKVHNQKIYDEITRQWELKNPEKAESYKYFLLKYRY